LLVEQVVELQTLEAVLIMLVEVELEVTELLVMALLLYKDQHKN
tara:strand:- start:497 stop:628 length:132 start_codon:yes stop_codon:yes gene_type:complete